MGPTSILFTQKEDQYLEVDTISFGLPKGVHLGVKRWGKQKDIIALAVELASQVAAGTSEETEVSYQRIGSLYMKKAEPGNL